MKSYIQRFSNEILDVPNVHPEFLSTIMAHGLRNEKLADSLVGEPAASWDDLLARVERFILIEESRRVRKTHKKRRIRGKLPSRTKKAFTGIEELCFHDRGARSQAQKDITFTDKDKEGINYPHEEALVVSAVVSNIEVRRILVDSGSSVDILFEATFRKMRMKREDLTPKETTLMGFEGSTTRALGKVTLPVSLGEEPRIKIVMVRFLVVDTSYPSYNIILGRPALNAIEAVISTLCLKIKFPTEYEIGEVRGSQWSARECRCHALGKIQKEEGSPTSTKGKINPVNTIKNLSLGGKGKEKYVQIGTNLSPGEEDELEKLLQNWEGVFEWEEGEITGISESIIRHELHVREGAKPLQQKKRHFGNERNQIIQEEVQRLLSLGYVREVQYPEWISNVVLVPKTGGKWRMCVDFTDLNKACPKDSYPLPRIELLVDSTSRCEHLSMLDAYQGYNQIKLAKEDQEKTSFYNGTRIVLLQPITKVAASAVLTREHEGEHRPVYYTSHMFQGAESRYDPIEKLVLALVSAARKLRPYFLAHPIIVLTDKPLENLLRKGTGSRMIKWSYELNEFELEYRPELPSKLRR
ncbi:UNVERIFIED_CONTAM: Retrovirus-related Pol polyprotein from transposon [Sesamum radiatum]|uniref:RNA-directed DNA polymerase n=1 Tax=Sesamum radiatum TaxID=300843 RepID=A0AAW2KC98_SESRA